MVTVSPVRLTRATCPRREMVSATGSVGGCTMIVSADRRLSGSGLAVRGRGCTRIGKGSPRDFGG